jgi:hypothetical protein
VTPSPRAFSRREPFDWPLLLKRVYLQPAFVWLLLAALSAPASRVLPGLLRASCTGPARDGAAAASLIVYILLVPALGASAWYLGFARKRLEKIAHRWVGDLSLVLLLLVSAGNAAVLAASAARRWPALAPQLSAMRAACWPGR